MCLTHPPLQPLNQAISINVFVVILLGRITAMRGKCPLDSSMPLTRFMRYIKTTTKKCSDAVMMCELTLHVEVAVEVRWAISIEHAHSAVSHFFISFHRAVMLIITVRILENHTNDEKTLLSCNNMFWKKELHNTFFIKYHEIALK